MFKRTAALNHLLWVFAACTSALGCASEETRPETPAVSVRDGRLVFADGQAFRSTLAELSSKTGAELDAFEAQFAGYLSMRSYGPSGARAPLHSEAVLSLMNQESMYQVGHTVVVDSGDVEYLVDDGKGDAVGALRRGDPAGPYVDAGDVIARPVREVSLATLDDNLAPLAASSFVDSGYQKDFTGSNGITYKFVHEVFGQENGYFLDIKTCSKFEYLKERWYGSQWLPAGETVEKHMYDLLIKGDMTLPFGTAFSYFSPHLTQTNNKDLCKGYSIPADCIENLSITGHYKATVQHPALNYETYDVNANWPIGKFCKEGL